MEPLSSHRLRQHLASALARSDDADLLRELEGALRQHKQLLRDPLRTPGKNADQRKILEEAKAKPAEPVQLPGRPAERLQEPLRRTLLDAALLLSDRLNTSEVLCWDLVKTASNQQRKSADVSELVFAAEELFFRDRSVLLHCLLEVLKFRGAVELSPALRELLAGASNDLLKDGLANELLKYLSNQPGGLPHAVANIPATAEAPYGLRNAYMSEMKVVAEAIFYVYYWTVISPEEAGRVLALLKDFSKAVKFVGTEAASRTQRSQTRSTTQLRLEVKPTVFQPITDSIWEYQVAYILLFTAISFLELRLASRESRTFVTQLAGESEDASAANGPLFGPVAFALGRFLLQRTTTETVAADPILDDRRIDAVFKAALNQNAFAVLRDIVQSRPFSNDGANKAMFLGVVDELITHYLTLHPMHVRHIKNAEEEAHRALAQARDSYAYSNQPPPPVPTQHYVNLLKLIAAVYYNRPELQLKFWLADEGEGPYRFLHVLSGENLAEWFFVPFIEMIGALASSPQSAANAYAMLKDYSKYASWNHFFLVLEKYYLDFQETAGEMISMEGGGFGRKDLREADLLGLQAILHLLQEVVRNNASNALLIAENTSWHALESLFGLLSCPVTPLLKADLLNTITAFAEVPHKELVGRIWTLLESTQILSTLPTQPGVAAPKDITFELQEVERPMGEYPETIAFLRLLAQLLVSATPQMLSRLGSGYRSGGFVPYLNFVRDSVFSQFDQGPYQNVADKWKVASAALLVLYRIIRDYNPAEDQPAPPPQPVPQQPYTPFAYSMVAPPAAAPQPPNNAGAELYKYLLSASERNKLWEVLSVRAESLMERRYTTSEGAELETALLLALKVVDSVLSKEMSSSTPSTQQTIDRLLVSKKLVVPLGRYVTYPYNSELALLAVRTLDFLAMKKQPLVSIFQEAREDEQIIDAFSERLQMDEPAENEEKATASTDESSRIADAAVPGSVRAAVLQLLQRPLRKDSHTDTSKFAHMLLGFDVSDHPRSLASASSLSALSPNCLQMIVSFLEQVLMCYEIIYRLVTSRYTAEKTLGYLRNRPPQQVEFFSDHIQQQIAWFKAEAGNMLPALWQRIYLIKSLAIDLRMCAREGQRTRENQLLELLYSVQSPIDLRPDGSAYPGEELDMYMSSFGGQGVQALEQPRMKMLELLDFISFAVDEPKELPRGAFLLIDFANYTRTSWVHKDLQLIDLATLHQDMLMYLQRAESENVLSSQQLQQIQNEIREVLRHALQRNRYRALLHAKLQLFESWSQLLAVTLSECYPQLRLMEKREEILYTMIDTLAEKLKLGGGGAGDTREVTSIGQGISSALLLLITRLREPGDLRGVRPVARLHSILGLLLRATVATGSSSFMRMNLYASLANYLQLCQQNVLAVIRPPADAGQALEDAHSIFRTFLQTDEIEAQQRQLEQGNQRLLGALGAENSSVGERLIDLMSQDACNGTPACRAVAFAALDSLMFYDAQHKWLGLLASKGYLRFFLDQLTTPLPADQASQTTVMLVNESILSLFKRLASTERGARHLVSTGVILRLADAEFVSLSIAPSGGHRAAGEDYLMDEAAVLEKLPQQALIQQVLQIIVAVLVSVRPFNEEAAGQAIDFIKHHSHLFSSVLKERRIQDLTALRSLQFVTAVFYQLAPYGAILQQRLELKAAKFDHLLMTLLCTLFSTDEMPGATSWAPGSRFSVLALAEDSDVDSNSEAVMIRTLTTLICRNLVGYCRVKSKVQERLSSPIFFAPQLSASAALNRSAATPSSSFSSSSLLNATGGGASGRAIIKGKPPSLSVLVQYLQTCYDRLTRNADRYTSIQRSLTHINDLPPPQLNKLAEKSLMISSFVGVPPTADTRNRVLLAQLSLQEELAARLKESSTLLYIIENILQLLWVHLRFFLSRDAVAAPIAGEPVAASPARSRTLALTSIPEQKQEELRRDANSLLSPLLAQLAKLERPHKSEFVALLTRKLRNLLTTTEERS